MSGHLDKFKKLKQLGNNINEKVMNQKTSLNPDENPINLKSGLPQEKIKDKSGSSTGIKKLYSLNLNVTNHKIIALHCKINDISMSSLFNDLSQEYITKNDLEEKYKALISAPQSDI